MGKEPDVKKSLGHRKLKILSAGCLILCSLAAYAIHVGRSPSQGTILKSGSLAASMTPPKPTVQNLETPYYSLTYSSNYKLLTGQPKDIGALDYQVLQSRTKLGNPDAMRVSFTIHKAPTGGVRELSSYKLSQAYPADYKVEAHEWGSDKGYIITKIVDNDTFRIILWPHADKVLVVAFVPEASGAVADYDATMADVTSTLAWK